MARRGHPALRGVRAARNSGYKLVRTAGNCIPAAELVLAILGGNAPEASYRFRAVIRRYVNRWIGAQFGAFAYGSTGGFAGLLRKLLGL